MKINKSLDISESINNVITYLQHNDDSESDLQDWLDIQSSYNQNPKLAKSLYLNMDTASREYISLKDIVTDENDRINASMFFGYQLLN